MAMIPSAMSTAASGLVSVGFSKLTPAPGEIITATADIRADPKMNAALVIAQFPTDVFELAGSPGNGPALLF